MIKWIAVFFAMAVTDYFWARYTVHVAEYNPFRAAWFATLVLASSAFTIIEYTTNWHMVIPAALGAAAGTFYAVKRSS